LELVSQSRLDFFGGDHFDGVPRAAVEEGAVGTFAGTLLTANAQLRVDFDSAKWGVILVGHPVHAVLDRAIGNTGRRACTAGATLRDDGELLGLLLAGGFDALGLGLALHDFSDGDKVLRQIPSP
jgi:hypothetical protein